MNDIPAKMCTRQYCKRKDLEIQQNERIEKL